MLPTQELPQNKWPIQTESERLEENTPRKYTGKKAGVEILISDKIDCKTKVIKRDTEGHFIIFKGRIHQEDINIRNIHAAKHRGLEIHKDILGGLQEKYTQEHNYIRGF